MKWDHSIEPYFANQIESMIICDLLSNVDKDGLFELIDETEAWWLVNELFNVKYLVNLCTIVKFIIFV